MKVRVDFTVEFDIESYRAAQNIDRQLTVAEIRMGIQQAAMDRIIYEMGDTGVDCKAFHNN